METFLLFALYLVFFCVGVIFVVWGSNGVVMGATLVNKLTKVPMFFLGMFMVALATTSPEFTVNIFSTIDGNIQIAIGNIVGSNIFNIAAILGLCSTIKGIHTDRNIVVTQVPLAAVAIFVLGLLCFDGNLSQLDGFILLGCFAVYLLYLYLSARRATNLAKQSENANLEEAEDDDPKFLSIFWDLLFAGINKVRSLTGKAKDAKAKDGSSTVKELSPVVLLIIYLIIGFGILIGGSRIMVTSAVSMATIAGMSESFIGLTIVAMGTSMPELAVSLMSIIKKKKDLAIGNIVGANVMNAFWALGFDTAFLRPLPFSTANMIDIYMAFGVAFLLWAFMYIGKKYELERWQGWIFIVGYVAYVVYKYVTLPKP